MTREGLCGIVGRDGAVMTADSIGTGIVGLDGAVITAEQPDLEDDRRRDAAQRRKVLPAPFTTGVQGQGFRDRGSGTGVLPVPFTSLSLSLSLSKKERARSSSFALVHSCLHPVLHSRYWGEEVDR